MSGARSVVTRLLIVIVLVDVALIVLNLAGTISFLNLDEESNFPTWWSSSKLLAAAAAALWCMRGSPPEHRRGLRGLAWPAVALTFTALSMDETATAHESLAGSIMETGHADQLRSRLADGDQAKDAFMWPILFAPAILGVVYFLGNVLWTEMRGDRRSLALGALGLAALMSAVLLEGPAVYGSAPIETWGAAELERYRRFTVAEESAEVIGVTLLLASLALHAERRARRGAASEALAARG